jgi:GNAT superfamily N-acetyltransferase
MIVYPNLPGKGVELRGVTSEDEGFLLEVYSSTRQEEMALVNWTEDQKKSFLQMQFNAQRQYYSEYYVGAQFQVVLWKNQPVGRLFIHQRDNEIRIMDIALLHQYRNHGIGTMLLQSILEQGKQHNLPVTIHVERFNPALSLYQRLGFCVREDKGVYLFMEWLPAEMEQ